ncbi:unnamed protein product [Peniophora sp. CBMAI 1063]|nr:unnamed protein product [Peniophora sp. CBMAI 1063]
MFGAHRQVENREPMLLRGPCNPSVPVHCTVLIKKRPCGIPHRIVKVDPATKFGLDNIPFSFTRGNSAAAKFLPESKKRGYAERMAWRSRLSGSAIL